MNYSLYLEETEGFIECTCCGCTVQLHRERASVLSGDKQIRWQISKTWSVIRQAV